MEPGLFMGLHVHTCSAMLRSYPPPLNPERLEEGIALCRPPRPSGEQWGLRP